LRWFFAREPGISQIDAVPFPSEISLHCIPATSPRR
jgi:hypothetical protein